MFAKIVDTLEQQATKLAFCINNQEYSYLDLASYVSGIRVLLRKERSKSHFIGLLADDTIETYASIIAIWLEGHAFVPLSPKSPDDRNLDILTQVNATCLLRTSPSTSLSNINDTITVIETKDDQQEKLLLNLPSIDEDRIICMLFTSGSTGVPKGVPYTLKNINATLDAFFALEYDLTSEDRFLQMFELTFDMSMLSYLPAWWIGASVFTVGEEGIKYLQAYQVLQDKAISFAAMVPSTLNLLRPYFKQIQLPNLRFALLGGEPFYIDLAMAWWACIPNARLINISGPCETTMACVGYELSRERAENKIHHQILAFGRPWKNTKTVIVDEKGQMLAANQEGELCFSGENVMEGYWNLPQKNKAIFLDLEVNGQMRRFYRSGDMAFQDDDGDLYSCGRKDYQYKIQGYKVELGEIEQLAAQYTGGLPVVAVVETRENGLLEIYLFVEGKGMKIDLLTDFLKQKLPTYMLPKKIRTLEQFPRTLSGKVDRGRLLLIGKGKTKGDNRD